jgi:hypothetical protein
LGVAPDPAQTPDPADLSAAIEHALAALDDLASLGEEVDDEWQYVQDLAASWRDRLQSGAAGRGTEQLAPPAGSAIMRLASEARLVDDPHRAIDWLSTFPQAVLVALGERP